MTHKTPENLHSTCGIKDLTFDEIDQVGGMISPTVQAANRMIYYSTRILQIKEWMTDYTRA